MYVYMLVHIYSYQYILPFLHSVATAFCRTVMPKLKYPFLMKSPFHNDVKMQALHVHVTTCTCCIFVYGCIIQTTA